VSDRGPREADTDDAKSFGDAIDQPKRLRINTSGRAHVPSSSQPTVVHPKHEASAAPPDKRSFPARQVGARNRSAIHCMPRSPSTKYGNRWLTESLLRNGSWSLVQNWTSAPLSHPSIAS
jgi:hypothetical protein